MDQVRARITEVILTYTNRLLEVCRCVTNQYWLKEAISDRDIISYTWELYPKNEKAKEGGFAFGVLGRISVPLKKIRDSSDVIQDIKKDLAS